MTESRRAWLISWAKGLTAAIVLGLLLAFAGAFGSGEAPLMDRLVYWLPTMLVGAVVGGTIADGFTAWPAMDERPILRGFLMWLTISASLSVLIWAMTNLMFGRRWEPIEILSFAGPVTAITGVMTLVGHLLDRPIQTHAAAAEAPPARFLDRLPPRLKGAELHAVAAEDHYLRLYTDRGTDLILMRLSDAVIEMEGLEGAQVHRSWWVAKEAVLGARRGDGRATLTIKGGVEAPVSRRYAPALRKAGWY